jgi:DNA-binding beta-propeller fold protein YncE
MSRSWFLVAAFAVAAGTAQADPRPTFVNHLTPPRDGLDRVCQLTRSPDGRIFAADAYHDRVVIYSANGTPATELSMAGNGDESLNVPTGVAFDADGNLYVAEQFAHRISKYGPNLVPLLVFGEGQLQHPTNLAFSPDGRTLYVTELSGNRVSMFDVDGKPRGTIGGPKPGYDSGQFDHPFGIAVDAGGDVFVADQGNHRIQRFTAVGEYVGEIGTPGASPGEFNGVVGLAFDEAGNLYATDQLNNRVQKFHHDGSPAAEWGSRGDSDGELYNPWCVLVVSPTRVWIGDTYNHRISVFDPTGKVREPNRARKTSPVNDPYR